jgi:hypothetical protein
MLDILEARPVAGFVVPGAASPIDRGMGARRGNHIWMYGRPEATKRRFNCLRISGRVSDQAAPNRGTQLGRPRRQAPVGRCTNRQMRASLMLRAKLLVSGKVL